MNLIVISIILVSCFMHAGWNLLARSQRSEGKFFWRMLFVTALIGFFPAVISELLTHSITSRAWFYVLGSGICCGVYYYSLTRAYNLSDFTVVYPIARSLPVLLVAFGDIARGRIITPFGWMGMSLVVLGCFLAPLHSFREFKVRRYFNSAIFFMILAALGTTGYSLLDKIASEQIMQGTATAARYCYFFFLIAFVVFTVLKKIFKTNDMNSNLISWKFPILASLLNFGAYWLVLRTYQMTELAGYVVAFRQFSIIIGVVLAFVIFKEKGKAVRLSGAMLIFIGLVLISIFGF